MDSMLHYDIMLLAHIVLFLIYTYCKECKQFLNIFSNSTLKMIFALPISSLWLSFIEGFLKKKIFWDYLSV